jgi:hypothetical protein
MTQAIIDISAELLRQLLFLPDGTEIVYTMQPEHPGTVRLVVDHPLIQDTGRGIPRLAPRWRKVQSPSTVTLVDWGLA